MDGQKMRTPAWGPGFCGKQSSKGSGSRYQYTPSALDLLLERLSKVRQTGADAWIACCPAHDDRTPSLSLRRVDDRVLIHCFAGCAPSAVMEALGLTVGDLFDRPPVGRGPLPAERRRRYGQAVEVLRALRHELRVLQVLSWICVGNARVSDEISARWMLAIARITSALELVL